MTEPAFTFQLPDGIDPKAVEKLMNPTPRDPIFEIYMRRGFKYYFRNSQGERFNLRFEDEQPDLYVGKKVKILDHTFHLAQQLQGPEAGTVRISVSFSGGKSVEDILKEQEAPPVKGTNWDINDFEP